MTFPAYPEYKDSGVEWVGKIPKSWKVHSLKHITKLKAEKASSKTFSVALENIEGWSGRFVESSSEFEAEGVKFSENQILFGKLRPYLAKVLLTKCEGEAVGDLYVLDPTEGVNPRYLQYRMLTREFIDVVDGSTYGSKMPRASWDFMGCMKIPTPTKSEQESISSFLDHETAKIDDLISEQEKLIELLNEKRQSVISNAVCRGLDPNVLMKDSGVEWLGMVPKHWNVKALKHIVAIPITDGPHETPEFIDEGVPFVSAEAVSSGEIDFSKIRGFISRESHEKYSLKYVPKRGDIFMIKSGATTGVCAIVETDEEFNIWSPLAVVRCMDDMEPHFVLNYMRSLNFQEAIALNWNFGTQQNIGMGVIENLMIPVPPHQEQIEISKRLSEFLKESNDLISEASNGITLLKERRLALISAAVTGQIDVRNFQPKVS